MRFDAIRDQEIPLAILKRALEAGRVPAAYLFTGPEGCGRTMAAVATAASFNCESGPLACGSCSSCRLFAAGNHPDFHMIAPEEGKRWIEIKQVRDLVIARAYLKPMTGRISTFVIRDAHLFHPNAANAFLKTLEEPPETTRFILIAPGRETVLPTIASRCQALPFRALTRSVLSDLLIQMGVNPDEAQTLAGMGGGSLKRALMFREEGVLEGMEGEFGRFMALPTLSPSKVLDLSQRWSRNRQGATRTLELMIQWYRDMLFLAEGGSENQVLTLSRMPAMREAARSVPSRNLAEVCEALEEAREALEANTNVQLTLDRLLFSVGKLTAAGEKRV